MGDRRMNRLALLHVPKTAGASVRAVAMRNYRDGENIHVKPAFGVGERTTDEAAWFKQRTTRAQRERCRLLTGHFRWGVHHELPGDTDYAVCLRDPVERVISLYRWLRQNPRPDTVRFLDGGFDSFVRSDLADIDNGMTRMLAGRPDVATRPLAVPVDELDFGAARLRLRCSTVVGVYRDVGSFIGRLAVVYGWDASTQIPRMHVSKTPVPRVDAKARAVLEERNRWDLELYDEAVRLASVS